MKTLPWEQMDCFQTPREHKLHQKLHKFQVSLQSQQPTTVLKNVHILIPTLRHCRLNTTLLYQEI
jgi:hypothetical protein